MSEEMKPHITLMQVAERFRGVCLLRCTSPMWLEGRRVNKLNKLKCIALGCYANELCEANSLMSSMCPRLVLQIQQCDKVNMRATYWVRSESTSALHESRNSRKALAPHPISLKVSFP